MVQEIRQPGMLKNLGKQESEKSANSLSCYSPCDWMVQLPVRFKSTVSRFEIFGIPKARLRDLAARGRAFSTEASQQLPDSGFLQRREIC